MKSRSGGRGTSLAAATMLVMLCGTALFGARVSAAVTAEASATGDDSTAEDPAQALAQLDPETRQRLMTHALVRDDSEALLRLLPSARPKDEELAAFMANLLHSAAAEDSHRVAAALIGQGYAVGARSSYTPLHEAAAYEALATAELLVAQGADVNADSGGWTPLHMALLYGTERPAFAVARMLMDHGANVNAQTTLFGWTPLHLAAYQASFGEAPALAVVQALLERGAEANVGTRLGGWTPVRAAHEGDANEAVLKMLAIAGGEDGGYDEAPRLPLYQNGRLEWRGLDEELESGEEASQSYADGTTAGVKGRFNMTFALPSAYFFHQDAIQGTFTAPGATERLLFENTGLLDEYGPYTVAALEDRHGNVLPLLAYNHYTDFVGICRDPATDTDTAMFQHSYDGSCCPWDDRVYFHYDAEAGTLLAVLDDEDLDVSTAAPDEQGTCNWRRKKAALATYREAIKALAVGELPKLAKGGTTQTLPTRAIPSPVVDEHLATLRQLPGDVVEVWEVGGSSRWKVVGVEYERRQEGRFSDPCEGVVLVWDATHEQWRSIYDCADLEATEVHDDVLTTALNDEECLWRRLDQLCHLEVDLATGEARLWDEPYGNDWVNWRERPGDQLGE